MIADYAAPISNMIALNDQIAQGTSDASLANDVRALNSLSLAKDQAAQQRALFFNAFTQQFFADGVQQALTTAQSEELIDQAAFDTTATPAEQNSFRTTVAGPRVNQAAGHRDLHPRRRQPGIGIRRPGHQPERRRPGSGTRRSPTRSTTCSRSSWASPETSSRAPRSLKRGAEQSALFTAIVTVVILLLVLIATLAVARSLVRPLRRLREGALDIATVQLPERVRQLGEAEDPAASLEVAPIDVLSTDEIGQVARAFDQVHSEAVRLAGNEAMLRSSFNAMFVNLSRRSQSLIERLVRMIDSLEQNEDDPERLSNLFSMDHLVTRMRRNSENLLLLAGHESARKWSEPVPLADVARAAASEIEQYSRVTLRDPARDRGRRAGGIRRGAPAGRAHRERHGLLPQGHPGARVGPGTGQRRRADRGQRQRGRRSRGPAGGDELAAGQPAASSTYRYPGTWGCSPWRAWPSGTGCGSGCAPDPRRG